MAGGGAREAGVARNSKGPAASSRGSAGRAGGGAGVGVRPCLGSRAARTLGRRRAGAGDSVVGGGGVCKSRG